MKKCFFILTFLTPFFVIAQSDSVFIKKADSSVLKTVKLGFAVPDIPAFKALGLDPSNILRPSEAKDIALMFGSFRSEGDFIIPKNLAAEITPALLINPWFTLQDYQRNGALRAFTKTRISIGTNEDKKAGTNNLALGLRTVLIDKGDFRLDLDLLKTKLYPLQDSFTAKANRALREMIIKSGGPVKYDSLYTRPQQDSILNVIHKQASKEIPFDETYNRTVEDFKKKNWNAARMDFAYSLVLQSPDSLLGNVQISKNFFWLVYATRPGKNNQWGQFLFSISDGIYRLQGKTYNEFTGNFRFYGGW